MAFLKGSMERTDSGNTGTEPTPEGTAPSPALAAARFRFSHIAALDGFRGLAVLERLRATSGGLLKRA